MSDENGSFFSRWSRLKQEARRQEEEEAPEAAEPEAEGAAEPCAEEEFDPSSLPPLESLGADSDYTAFMRKEVPKALRLAALRKAWASDPVICNYRTPADYDWDFNAPGYGQLLPTDDPAKFVKALFDHLKPRDEAGSEDAQPAPPEAGQTELAGLAPTEPAPTEPAPAEPELAEPEPGDTDTPDDDRAAG